MVSPSFAGKQAVSDAELDLVTAAGQPVIISAGAGSTVNFTAVTSIAQTIQTGSQTLLRALALNNVAGENQVANGINISGAASATSLQQSNTITQSWGSTSDITIGAAGSASASIVTSCAGALICKSGVQVSTLPGIARRLSRAADIIIEGGAGSSVTYSPTTNIQASIDGGAQTNLVALVVNNVTGLNQVGNGVNIYSGGLSLNSSGIGILNSGAGTVGGQSNSLGAYRGTPANFSRTTFP